jgi:hypothetical protein
MKNRDVKTPEFCKAFQRPEDVLVVVDNRDLHGLISLVHGVERGAALNSLLSMLRAKGRAAKSCGCRARYCRKPGPSSVSFSDILLMDRI